MIALSHQRAHARSSPRSVGYVIQLARDAHGGVSLEYLAIVSGIALGLLALAYALRDVYANGFLARSFALLGVQ